MSNIHYFPRYSQKENMVTNNTLLLFSRLYQNSPGKFTTFINLLLEESGVELNPTVQFKQQERVSSGRIPDGLIQQESFKVVIETKLYGQEHINQIKGHWKAFDHEDKQIFLWINKEKISAEYHKKIIDELNEFNDTNKTEISFAAATFNDICHAFNEILPEYDLEMKALIEDYEEFCNESGLLDNTDSKIRVVLTGNTFKENLHYGLYFHPKDRGYQNTKYIGLYNNKAVRAIGEVDCIIDVKYNPDLDEFDYIDSIHGEFTKELMEKIKEFTKEAKKKYGYSEEEERRFFAVGKYYSTSYKKLSKGGLMGNRYIDLSEAEGFIKGMTADEIAHLLDGKEWGI